MKKVARIGDEFYMPGEEKGEETNIYSVKNIMNLTAINLAEDIGKYRKGENGLSDLIVIETDALNALAAAAKILM